MENMNAAGGYGPPGGTGGWGPPGGGYGAPPGAPPAPPAGGYGAPPAGGYGSPSVGYVLPANPNFGRDINTTMPLVLNALALVCCGASLFTAPLSILGLVFAVKAKNAKGIGDLPTARAKARTSMIFFFGTLLLAPVLFLVFGRFLQPEGLHR